MGGCLPAAARYWSRSLGRGGKPSVPAVGQALLVLAAKQAEHLAVLQPLLGSAQFIVCVY